MSKLSEYHAMQKRYDAIHPPDEPPKSLKVVCAWCGHLIADGADEPISHGICLACAKDLRREI